MTNMFVGKTQNNAQQGHATRSTGVRLKVERGVPNIFKIIKERATF